MAAGAVTLYQANLDDLRMQDLLSATVKLSLHTSAYTPSAGTAGHSVAADLTNELPTAAGYTAGGATLTGKLVTAVTGGWKFESDDAACDMACSDAGYIALRTPSLRWRPYPHAMWASMLAGDIINWHPHEPASGINVLCGYEGVADRCDHAKPRAWTPNKLMLAACVFAAGVVLWRIKRLFRGS